MITYLLDTLVNSIKTSLINKLGLDPSTEVDLDDFPQLIDDIPILDSVEELTVTENGTYTGTDGVTYNPVNVNLPLGSKSVTANGTYTASDDSLQGYSSVTVDIDDTDLYRDTTDSTYESVKTLSNCGAFPMLSLTAEINAVQDLHGYGHPWVGGAGKNKLEFSLADCKSMTQNSGATWSGNVLSHAGVNFSVEEDGTVKTNGTASSNAILRYAYITPSVSGDYIINGLPQDGGDDTFEIMLVDGTFTLLIEPNSVASGTTVTLTAGTRYGIQIIFRNGYNSNGLTFKPMIRLATETDATFAPYSNICPISGWDEAVISVSPLNIAPLYNGQIYGDGRWISSDMRLTNVSSGQDNSYFLKAGTYTLDYDKLNSNAPSLLQCSALTKDDSYTIIDNFATAWNSLPFTFTLTQDGYLYFTIRKDADTTLNVDDYKAKVVKNTYTIDLDGTRYGGKVDLVSGVMTVDRAYVDLGTLDFTKTTQYNYTYFTGSPITNKKFNSICSNYVAVEKARDSLNNGEIGVYNTSNSFSPCIRDDAKADLTVEQFKTAMSGVQLVYELATPVTYQLTPTQVRLLLGINNLWANSGDVGDARYFKKVEL